MYNYKLYDKTGTFKKVINPLLIMSEFLFSAQKNGVQGSLSINIDGIDTDFIQNDIVKVYRTGQPTKLVYTGTVYEIHELYDNGEKQEVVCLGLGSILSKIMFEDGGGDRTFTISTKTASQLVQDIVTVANGVNSLLIAGDIDSSTGNVHVEFDNDNCLDALKKVTDLEANFYFYIDEKGQVNFTETLETYYVTYQKDLHRYEENNVGNIVNKVYFEYNGGTKTYTETASVTLYGVREAVISDQRIYNVTTADKRMLEYFAENAYPQLQKVLVVNNQYAKRESLGDITRDEATMSRDYCYNGWDDEFFQYVTTDDIRVGNNIKILNFPKVVEGQIEKAEYRRDSVNITLNKDYSFISLITNGSNN